MVESKTMKELRAIKRKISKEISKLSWEELQQWMTERKKKREKELLFLGS